MRWRVFARRWLRNRVFAAGVAAATLVGGYGATAPFPLTWWTAAARTIWIVPASWYLGSTIRRHRRYGSDEAAQQLLAAIRHDHPEV